MREEVYRQCITTGELHFESFWSRFTHYSLVYYLLSLLAMLLVIELFIFVNTGSLSIEEGVIWLTAVPLCLAFLTYFRQRKRLKFQIIQTSLTHNQIVKIIREVANERKWIVTSSNKIACTAKTVPGFFSGSWGEQITILYNEDKVFVNSICDTDQRPSIVSFGRNQKNEEELIHRITKASHALDAGLK